MPRGRRGGRCEHNKRYRNRWHQWSCAPKHHQRVEVFVSVERETTIGDDFKIQKKHRQQSGDDAQAPSKGGRQSSIQQHQSSRRGQVRHGFAGVPNSACNDSRVELSLLERMSPIHRLLPLFGLFGFFLGLAFLLTLEQLVSEVAHVFQSSPMPEAFSSSVGTYFTK